MSTCYNLPMLAKPYKRPNPFEPDYIVSAVTHIDFDYLMSQGIKAVLIDLDGTVVSRGTFEVNEKLTSHLKEQTVRIYIATNRPKSRDLRDLKQSLNASGVIHPKGIFMKPFPRYFKQAVLDHGLSTSEIAMIGDRYVQDIFGANSAGLTTILVHKLGKPKGYIDTMISGLEKKYTNKLVNKYKPVVFKTRVGK